MDRFTDPFNGENKSTCGSGYCRNIQNFCCLRNKDSFCKSCSKSVNCIDAGHTWKKVHRSNDHFIEECKLYDPNYTKRDRNVDKKTVQEGSLNTFSIEFSSLTREKIIKYDSLSSSNQQKVRGLIVFKRLLKGLTLKQSKHEMLWNKCGDCKRRLPAYLLKKVIACSDYHTSGVPCCYKYICKLGCFLDCTKCNARNYFNTDLHYEGYADSIECWKCKDDFNIEVEYWGNLKENCRRYCLCGLDRLDYFMIQGYKTQKESRNE